MNLHFPKKKIETFIRNHELKENFYKFSACGEPKYDVIGRKFLLKRLSKEGKLMQIYYAYTVGCIYHSFPIFMVYRFGSDYIYQLFFCRCSRKTLH